MFVRSVRLSKNRILGLCGLILGLVLAAAILPGLWQPESVSVALMMKGASVADNDARIAYLATYGWIVEPEAESIEEVVIPQEFSEVFEKYNAIQLEQGFDLTKQKGQRVKRYTYIVTNYPDEPDYVRANLFVCKGKVVAGDICSLKVKDGFLHGLEREEA